jgi:hypothetical protein
MGRKPDLTYRQQIAVGATAERLWKAECKREEAAAVRAAFQHVDVEWQKARDARQRGEPLPYYHEEDVLFALAFDQQLDPEGEEEPRRVVTIQVKRPWGKRRDILRKVAATATGHYGQKIGTRMVDKCWKLFRAFAAEAD